MPPTPVLFQSIKQSIYVLAIALVIPVLLTWWVFTLAFDRANLFLLVTPPFLALGLLWALGAVLRGALTPRAERLGFAVVYAFAVAALLLRVIWPPPAALSGLDSLLLIVVSLMAYLALPPRRAVMASGSLLAVTVASAWTLLARQQAAPEVQLAAIIRQSGDLTVIGLLYVLAWMRQVWAQESAAQESRLRLASTDLLTDLPNRRGMYEVIERVVQGVWNAPLTVVLVDVDSFKSINDVYGHHTGDEVLRSVARLLRSGLREGDEVGRWGGEEFLLVLPQTELSDGLGVAERLRTSLEEARLLRERPVTASFGAASWRPGDTFDELLQRADEALYRAKNEGKNQVCWDGLNPLAV